MNPAATPKPYTRVGKQPRADGEKTKESILDAAEYLFSYGGLDGVSIRQITKRASTDLGSINYYFGSKIGLFRAVLIRRVAGMTEQRLESLSKLRAGSNKKNAIREILAAFIAPLFGDSPDQCDQLANYRRLVALVANSKAWQEEVFRQHYDQAAEHYIGALSKQMPEVSVAQVCWYFNFFLGALTNSIAETGRVDRLSGGLCESADLEDMQNNLLNATVPAFMALLRT